MIQKEKMIGQETVTDRNGTQMKRAEMADFEAALHRQFPDGLAIPLPDYRLADLMDLKDDLDNEREFMRDDVTFDGLIGRRNEHIVTDGMLHTELHIPPGLYSRVYPDEESYPLDGPQADDMDWEDRAATRLLHEHGNDLTGAAVGVVIREDIMHCLHIEGVPFPEFMQDVERTNCILDSDARILVALKRMYAQPLDADITVPDVLVPLMAQVTDRYQGMNLTSDMRRKLNGELLSQVEKMLARCGLLYKERKNVLAAFSGDDAVGAARQATVWVNGRYAPTDVFAVRNGDSVEVCFLTTDVRKRAEVMNVLRCDPHCSEITDKPFLNLELQHRAVALCRNGQLLIGYVGTEGLQTRNHYRLVARDGERYRLTPKGSSGLDFSTDGSVTRFMRDFKGEFMPVSHFHHLSDFTRQQVMDGRDILSSHDAVRGTDVVKVSGQVNGFPFEKRALDEADIKVYIRYQNKYRNPENDSLVMGIMADKYFNHELAVAWDKEQQLVGGIRERMGERQAQLDRITNATLYGRADDIHIRCRIDGVQQSGRKLAETDAQELRFLADTAKTLGRDKLVYRNFIHESRILDMAANAFADVLSQQVEQERTRTFSR